MNLLEQTLEEFGADIASLRMFDVDGPDLLPYATLLTARDDRSPDLYAISGVYEWQNSPLMFLVSADHLQNDKSRLDRVRRIVAMRGDAPYLGVVAPGRLHVYRVSLDANSAEQARVNISPIAGHKSATFAYLGNTRPGLTTGHRKWISQVILRLLQSSIGKLKYECGIGDDDAISLVGRALFTRFLGDRNLLSVRDFEDCDIAELFDDRRRARKTSRWLDETFNGDFLPLTPHIFRRMPDAAFVILGNILRRAPEGQMFLGWRERWDYLDFAHIPVGVLSQAYEYYLREHAPERQRKEGGYYTPRPIAELMVRASFLSLERSERADKAKVLDPAAGAGVFLITAFRQLVCERWRRDKRRPNTHKLREILYGQITGFDINEAALRFAALGLYLMSIELDGHPEPVRKLRFENLRGAVLHKIGQANEDLTRSLGSLGPEVSKKHDGLYDLVIGNPPWSSGTRLPNWSAVEKTVARIARERLSSVTPAPPLPNEGLDLPFVWRAMEWAKPSGQIAFALHARLLFQQGDGMPEARRVLFDALDVSAIVNGVELRQTKVWPEISAPFCLLFARNRIPPPGSGFRLVSPRLESSLNNSGVMRIDATNAEIITSRQVAEQPELLKILFRGSQADLQIYDRIKSLGLPTLEEYWAEHFGIEGGRPRFAGNGYQKLRRSSRTRKHGDGLAGAPADYLSGLPELTTEAMKGLFINTDELSLFTATRIHDPRPRSLFEAPLLIVHKSPPADFARIRVAVADNDLVFNETYYGYSARHHPHGKQLVRYLALLLGSTPALWLALITSGEFGFEREVIEKSTIDGILIPDFETLASADKRRVESLFKSVAVDSNPSAWKEIDAWIASLYGLHERELQVIADTLRFNLPFAENKKDAQARPSREAVEKFCDTLVAELQPWGHRSGKEITAEVELPSNTSPWRGIKLCLTPARAEIVSAERPDWSHILKVADRFAATEVIYPDADAGCLWLGRLNQARYWSQSQARLVAQRVIWEHIALLAGRSAQ